MQSLSLCCSLTPAVRCQAVVELLPRGLSLAFLVEVPVEECVNVSVEEEGWAWVTPASCHGGSETLTHTHTHTHTHALWLAGTDLITNTLLLYLSRFFWYQYFTSLCIF